MLRAVRGGAVAITGIDQLTEVDCSTQGILHGFSKLGMVPQVRHIASAAEENALSSKLAVVNAEMASVVTLILRPVVALLPLKGCSVGSTALLCACADVFRKVVHVHRRPVARKPAAHFPDLL